MLVPKLGFHFIIWFESSKYFDSVNFIFQGEIDHKKEKNYRDDYLFCIA